MLTPDAVYECTNDYNGLTKQGKSIRLRKGMLYFKTAGPKFVYLNEFDNPSKQLPWLEPKEFETLANAHLVKTVPI